MPRCEDFLASARGRELRRRVRQLAGQNLADDIEQDIAEYAYVEWATFQNEDHVVGVCLLKARALVVDHHRRFGPKRLEMREEFSAGDLGEAPDPVDLLMGAEDVRARWAAFLGLPARLRAILLAHAHAEEQYDEVARRHGMSAGAVRVQVHRGRQRLRDSLQRALPCLVPVRWAASRTRGARRWANLAQPTTAAGRVVLGLTVVSTAVTLTPARIPITMRAVVASAVDLTDFARPRSHRAVLVARSTRPSATTTASKRRHASVSGLGSAPDLRAAMCVNAAGHEVCAGAGSSTDDPGDPTYVPGDEIYVDTIDPVGRQGVTQNQVPVCDKVPSTTGPVGCEHHP